MNCIFVEFATPQHDETVKLRDLVLRKPLGLEFTTEEMELEYNQFHMACYNDSEQLLGCLILVKLENGEEVKMRQVAVHPDCQRRGVGQKMAAESEAWGKEHHLKKMVLHARIEAVPFYDKLGYAKEGKPFLEVGIEHYKMSKKL